MEHSRDKKLTALLAWLFPLLCATLAPAALFYLNASSSHAAGLAVAGLVAGVTAWASAAPERWNWSTAGVPRHWLRVGLVLLAFITLHGGLAMHAFDLVLPKALASLGLAACLLIGGAALAALLQRAASTSLRAGLALVFAVLLIICCLGLLRVQPAFALAAHDKPLFPFTEPSHFATLFLPYALALCTSARGWRQLALLAICGLVTLYIRSLTLLIGYVMLLMLIAPRRLWFVALIACIGALAVVNPTYYLERLDFSAASNNISSLVYLQGWQLAWHEVQLTHGWGMGFQQLGLHKHVVSAGYRLLELEGRIRNTFDGSFTAAKLLAEFGVFGLLALLAYSRFSLRFASQLRGHATGRISLTTLQLLARACFVAFGIELFVRGAGYFTGGALLFCASCWMLVAETPAMSASISTTKKKGKPVPPEQTHADRLRRRGLLASAVRRHHNLLE